MADETLSEAALAQARTDAAVWTDEHAYALLPYSFCVLESLTIEQVGSVSSHDALSAASTCLRTQLRASHLFTPAPLFCHLCYAVLGGGGAMSCTWS